MKKLLSVVISGLLFFNVAAAAPESSSAKVGAATRVMHVGVIQSVNLDTFFINIGDVKFMLHPRARVHTSLSDNATVYELRPGMSVRAAFVRGSGGPTISELWVVPKGATVVPRRR